MFGRKKKTDADETPVEYDVADSNTDTDEFPALGTEDRGPYDATDFEDSEPTEGRLDLGSVLVPVPDGGQIQVEMSTDGSPQAVHLVTQYGRITVAVYAAPKSPGQWREVAGDLAPLSRRLRRGIRRDRDPTVLGDQVHRLRGAVLGHLHLDLAALGQRDLHRPEVEPRLRGTLGVVEFVPVVRPALGPHLDLELVGIGLRVDVVAEVLELIEVLVRGLLLPSENHRAPSSGSADTACRLACPPLDPYPPAPRVVSSSDATSTNETNSTRCTNS